MKKIFRTLAALALIATPALALDVVKFEQNLYTGTIDDEIVTTILVNPGPDSIQTFRLAIKYDETKVTLTDITEGADWPVGYEYKFINWDGADDADVIWIALVYPYTKNEAQYWSGEAWDLTWTLDAAVTNSLVEWTELPNVQGCNVNYVDVNLGWSCTEALRRYTKCCSGSQCGTGGGPSPGQCIDTQNFYGTKFTVKAGRPVKNVDRQELSPGKAAAMKLYRIAREEAKIAALPADLQSYVRKLLAGGTPDEFETQKAMLQFKSMTEAKELYK